ncbi:MAG TPA: AtpZ/AtpI family protein [Polyangia bacterium]|nr:AtpZ/AtpI family protein [Polyangia bacterium]
MSAAGASAIGIEMVVALGLGYWIGSRIDRHFHTNPWFTIFFFLAGVGACVKAMVRVVRDYKRENPDQDERGNGGG